MTAFGCGQCMACRINRRRLWTHRIILEALCHEESSFWTLTYSPENQPASGSLDPVHLRNFLKRLRKMVAVRYYAVGEYGDDTWRPHYHLALFGVPPCRCVIKKRCVCLPREAWGLGLTEGLPLVPETAAYIAGYVTKKMTRKDDPRLDGRYPEFARMSLRPGIGAPAVAMVGETYSDPVVARALAAEGDVPSVLKHGLQSFPLGRYLRARLRKEIGMSDGEAPDTWSIKASAEMCALYTDYLVASENKGTLSLGGLISEMSAERIRQMEGKARIFASRRRANL